MKRNKQHVIDEEGSILLRNILPSNWILRNVLKDYGVDFELEIVDNEIVSGNRILIQLKSTERISIKTVQYSNSIENETHEFSADYIPFSISTKELKYATNCGIPIILFLADIVNKKVYWLPLREEVICNINNRSPKWRNQKTTTVRIPTWNNLNNENKNNFPGLRWYALEPSRHNAFTILHYYYHEFQYSGGLSGYSIGDGWIDYGEKQELIDSLILAKEFLSEIVQLDVLFGVNGIDYYTKQNLSFHPSYRDKFIKAMDDALLAIEKLETEKYNFHEISFLIGSVNHAISMMSTAISAYQGFRQKFLLNEANAFWRFGNKDSLSCPIPSSRQNKK
jgi:Domain of unknown function (DUF4365)